MPKARLQAAVTLLSISAIFVCRFAWSQEFGAQAAPWPSMRYPSNSEFEYLLTQAQPEASEEEAEAAEPEPPPRRIAQARRRRTYRLPSMFGDFFGGSFVQATLQPAPVTLPVTIFDGAPVDLFVRNTNGGDGADPSGAVVINVHLGPAGPIAASSIGAGLDLSGDGQPDTYPISEPMIPGISPPPPPGPGAIAYAGGTAVYTAGGLALPPPPADNSVGEGDDWALAYTHIFTPAPVLINVPLGGAVRRGKIAENNSPVPRDRLLWNYNFFNDVPGRMGDVNRYIFGFEHTLFHDMASVEVRFPFASTLAVDQVADGTLATDTEFGDVTVILKGMLLARDQFVASGGLGVSLPVAEDSRVFLPDGGEIIHVRHQSVHLTPFVGMLHGFDSGWYWQSFLQLDIDANGDPIRVDPAGISLRRAGVLQDQTLLFVDFGIGYWLTGDPEDTGTPAIAATAELHYATTLQDADAVTVDGLSIRNLTNRYDVPNLTLGSNIQLARGISVRPAVVIPLKSGDDQQFDYEAMLQVNIGRQRGEGL